VEKVQHEILERPVKVYNFEFEDFHTYYVGADSVLVHNICAASKGLPTNGQYLSSTEALDLADSFLGVDYSEVCPGGFVSLDKTRRVRMTESDLSSVNNHAGAPHLNFELIKANPKKKGSYSVIQNSHIFIFD